MNSFTYPELVAAIERVHRQYKDLDTDDAVKDNLRFQYQALLEKEEKYFELVAAEPEEEVKPKKKKKSNMSKENREKAAQRMRDMVARKKAEREAA